MKVVLSPSGQPVIITHFDQKLRDLRTLKQVRGTYQRSLTHRRDLAALLPRGRVGLVRGHGLRPRQHPGTRPPGDTETQRGYYT